MAEKTASQVKSVHHDLQTLYSILKSQGFSAHSLAENEELYPLMRRLLASLDSISIIEGKLVEKDRVLQSGINLLIEIAQEALESGWNTTLLIKLAESDNRESFPYFSEVEPVIEKIEPDVFLHVYRMGKKVGMNVNLYIEYFQKYRGATALFSVLPVYTNEICKECLGKKKITNNNGPGDSIRSVCSHCGGRGRIEETKQQIMIFYLKDLEKTNGISDNSLIVNFWKHYSSTKLRLLGNAILKSNYLGKNSINFFKSCNNDAIMKQYKTSTIKIRRSAKTYWSLLPVLKEHDRIVHLRLKLVKDNKIANRNPKDRKARKRVNKHNNAINSIYRANLELLAGSVAGKQAESFVNRSIDISKKKYTWISLFETYHPILMAEIIRDNDLESVFIDHFHSSEDKTGKDDNKENTNREETTNEEVSALNGTKTRNH